MANNLVLVSFLKLGELNAKLEGIAPMSLIGYKNGEPVYRTMNTLDAGKHEILNSKFL
jgi:hypothetical protein